MDGYDPWAICVLAAPHARRTTPASPLEGAKSSLERNTDAGIRPAVPVNKVRSCCWAAERQLLAPEGPDRQLATKGPKYRCGSNFGQGPFDRLGPDAAFYAGG